MILAIDVQYTDRGSACAGVAFDEWDAVEPKATYDSTLFTVSEYVPGAFYLRELPCILNLLREHELQPDTIVIDGYVFLDGHARAGLGKYLFDALDEKVQVIGVAKTSFANISEEFQVIRGGSKKGLFVTSAGVDVEVAKGNIVAMHGGSRMPKLLKLVDQLCRQRAAQICATGT